MKNRNFFLKLFLGILMAGNTACTISLYHDARITIRVTDDAGRPFEGAKAAIGFIPHDYMPRGLKFLAHTRIGMTDADGLFSASGISHGECRYRAGKDGYYETAGKYSWSPQMKLEGRKLIPWNPTIQVILRKIMDPVPMYAKDVNIAILEPGKPFGFDLEKGDWVEPYGKGKIADMIFRCISEGDDEKNFEKQMELSFSNDGDGIQAVMAPKYYEGGSALRLPNMAPESDYLKSWSKKVDRKTENDKNRNFVFRVRSRSDGNGNVISALYGKIYGDFGIPGVFGMKKIGVSFQYYLNPDGTKNLEFDPKRNLMKRFADEITLEP